MCRQVINIKQKKSRSQNRALTLEAPQITASFGQFRGGWASEQWDEKMSFTHLSPPHTTQIVRNWLCHRWDVTPASSEMAPSSTTRCFGDGWYWMPQGLFKWKSYALEVIDSGCYQPLLVLGLNLQVTMNTDTRTDLEFWKLKIFYPWHQLSP